MTEIKVYYPDTIIDNPFPTEAEGSGSNSSTTTKQVFAAEQILDKSFPTKRPAIDLISTSLNTQSRKVLAEFQFSMSGAIQIGEYQSGVSGDIRISPAGIVGRNSAGNTTFSIDGETGSAVFAGTIQTGTLVSGTVIVGDNSLIMDGAERRFIVNDGTTDRILIGVQTGGF